MRKGGQYPPSGYDELDNIHMIPRSEQFRITPSPGAITDRYGNHLPIFNIKIKFFCSIVVYDLSWYI